MTIKRTGTRSYEDAEKDRLADEIRRMCRAFPVEWVAGLRDAILRRLIDRAGDPDIYETERPPTTLKIVRGGETEEDTPC